MKAKSEPTRKSRSNQPMRQTRISGKPDPSSSDCPREQMIAEAAYFHAERRGFEPGDEMSDWLRAEADVEALLATRH